MVHTAEPSEATTSAVAGAIWNPWLVKPRHRVLRWAEHTLATLRNLAAHRDTGVRLVGLRPTRPHVQVDLQQHPSGATITHNYGHGGAGVSLSWGCATEITDLLSTATPPPP